MSATLLEKSSAGKGPAWEIATLFSDQGDIHEGEYLWLTRHTNKLVEFTDGRVEVLPVPTTQHQLVLAYIYQLLRDFITSRQLGLLVFAALRVKIRDGKFREPDVVIMLKENLSRAQDEFWLGADLVVEIVSPYNPERDLVEKRIDYAEAGIPEYWIVDPRFSRVTVLTLKDGVYVSTSEATENGTVASTLLDGFRVEIAPVFAAGKIN